LLKFCCFAEEVSFALYIYEPFTRRILWYIRVDLWLVNGRETNEITAIAMQQLRIYATVLQLLLGSGLRATMEVLLQAVISLWSASRLYYSTGRVQCSAVELSELVGE
jgi:hypothetical protein